LTLAFGSSQLCQALLDSIANPSSEAQCASGLGDVRQTHFFETASSCTSISSSCTSIIFKIPAIDMSKLQNYPCCYKLRFWMEEVQCSSEWRWKVWQWWEVRKVLEWRIKDTFGDRQLEWVAEKQRESSSSRYLISSFLFFTDCRNRKNFIFTVSISRRFKIKILDTNGL